MKLVVIIISILSLLACQGKTDGFRLKGELTGKSENGWVYLMDADQKVYYDSVQLNQGQFEFIGKVNAPELLSIVYFKNPARRVTGWADIMTVPVYVENSEIRVSVPFEEIPSKLAKKMPESLHIEGSVSHDLYREYMQQVEPLSVKYREVFDLYRQSYYRGKGTEEDVFRNVRTLDSIRDSIYRCGVDFIKRHGDSRVAFYVAGKLAVDRYGREEARRVAALFPEAVKATEEGRQVQRELLDKPLYCNDMLPDIEVLDTDLQKKMLSECVKKGRYTLVEFWASWCGPCRHDIPQLKKTYARFHDKGFDIVSVSIDSEIDKWGKAVSEEGMNWMQTCASEGEEGVKFGKKCLEVFGINGVPSGFLVDPEGRVVNVEARGGWLNMELAQLFEK